MNRKGDISITILVLGVVALCFLTIFSFITFGINFSESFAGVGLIETMEAFDEEKSFFERTDFLRIGGENFEQENLNVSVRDGKLIGEVYDEGLFFGEDRRLVRVEYSG